VTTSGPGEREVDPPDHVDAWPRWATEQVRVQEPQAEWGRRGQQLCEHLDLVLARWLVAPVEHVGSTAVPGLAAKPVTDVQAAVSDLASGSEIARVLAPAGWKLVPIELDARPWRRLLVHVVDDHRAAHLHLLLATGRRWHEQLAFRDALRADPELVREYAGLKRALAAEHGTDREAYTAGKECFVRRVLLRSTPP
jgi:GrpB-like predicted nucleotidyltransferase (UPF0157 family)